MLGRYKAFEAELSIDGGETTHEASPSWKLRTVNGIRRRHARRAGPQSWTTDISTWWWSKGAAAADSASADVYDGLAHQNRARRVTRAKTVTMRAKNMTVNLDGKLLRVDEAHYELLPGAVRMKNRGCKILSKRD